MAKENEFNETLEKGVQEDVLRDKKIQELADELKKIKDLAIKTPEQSKKEKELEAEIAKLKGEIRKEEKSKDKNIVEIEDKEERKSEQSQKFDIKTASYDQLLARREEVKLALEEALASPVKDPKKIEQLQKELDELEKAIISLEKVEVADEKEDKKTEKQEKAEVEEQQKDDKNLSEKEKQEKEVKEAELKQAYYNAMVKFYAIREINAKKLSNSPDRLVNTDGEYLQEIKAEDAMYRARDEYLKLGKADPYTAERESLNEQAKKCEKQNRDILKKKTEEYRQQEIELAKLQKQRAEKEEEIAGAREANATPAIMARLKKDLAELDNKIKNKKQDLAKIKDNLSQAMETLELRRSRRRELNLESREYAAQSTKEQANIRYANNIDAKSRNDYVQAGKLQVSSIKQEVERNEDRYNQIKKELKKLKEKEPNNFEKRLELLEELDDASQQLKVSREVQRDVERGIEPDTDEAIKQAEKDYKSKEERKKDFIKETEKVREVAEAEVKSQGEQAVVDPEQSEEEHKKEVLATGIAAAVMLGDENDTFGENVDQGIQGAVVAECVLPGVSQQVKDLNDPNQAQEYVEQTEKIEAAKEAREAEEHAMEQAEG